MARRAAQVAATRKRQKQGEFNASGSVNLRQPSVVAVVRRLEIVDREKALGLNARPHWRISILDRPARGRFRGRAMTALRTLLSMAFVGLAGATAVQAADLPSRGDPYAPGAAYAPITNWTGFYLGAHLGGGWGESGPVDTSGLVGGFHGGYNYQVEKFVFGGEADFSFANISNESFTEEAKHDWLGSIRGRAGYSFGNIMAYGTLGFAFADASYRSLFGVTSDTVNGWVIGAGAEMMVMPNVTIRAEYLRYELGSSLYPSNIGLVSIDSSVNVIRAGASYKF
jgi:outer membrane immunogenic protein